MATFISAIDLSSTLSSDYEKLYASNKYTDVSINVGREPNNKIFLAHSVVLCTRSTYFEKLIVENTEEFQRTVMAFEYVTPEIFEILLGFIYTGKVAYNSSEVIDWISLLNVSCQFELDDFVTAVGDYLINCQKEWITGNILELCKCALSSSLLNKLLDYCNDVMISSPEIIFKSDSLMNLPKETLITLLKHDELNMEEIEIWLSVIEWTTKQVSGLVNEPNDWSVEDVTKVKAIISDCIPHIRFFNIPSEDFQKKIVPYDEVLTKELRRDIMFYYLNKDYQPKFTVLPQRKRRILTNDQSKREQQSFNSVKPSSANSSSLSFADSGIVNSTVNLCSSCPNLKRQIGNLKSQLQSLAAENNTLNSRITDLQDLIVIDELGTYTSNEQGWGSSSCQEQGWGDCERNSNQEQGWGSSSSQEQGWGDCERNNNLQEQGWW